MSDERPEALLKSALEKIVYFEARSEQLSNELSSAKGEVERLKAELGHAAQREIELRRQVASLEVERARAHRDRDELGRVHDALRAERAALMEKILEASRIHASGADEEQPFDLASFIAQLRSEVLARGDSLAAVASEVASVEAPALAISHPPRPAPSLAPGPQHRATPIAAHAERLMAAGRLTVSDAELSRLSGASAFVGRTEETLFGFSVRELSAPDAPARARAAERLQALGQAAAAPALATALHAERDPEVLVALLSAFGELASQEGAPIVLPLLDAESPEVRISALKALLALDATQAGPHLSAAMKDADRAVRRRASLLALGLSGEAALALGREAIRDSEAEVRSLGALVLGASAGAPARELLLSAMRDPDRKVRKAAAQSLSRILGEDVSAVVDLDDAQRRREVRRLGTLPSRPVHPAAPQSAPLHAADARAEGPRPGAGAAARTPGDGHAQPSAPSPQPAPVQPSRPSAEVTPAARAVPEELCAAVLGELRCAIRGRTVNDLLQVTGRPQAPIHEACELLVARGHAVRRGQKFFAA